MGAATHRAEIDVGDKGSAVDGDECSPPRMSRPAAMDASFQDSAHSAGSRTRTRNSASHILRRPNISPRRPTGVPKSVMASTKPTPPHPYDGRRPDVQIAPRRGYGQDDDGGVNGRDKPADDDDRQLRPGSLRGHPRPHGRSSHRIGSRSPSHVHATIRGIDADRPSVPVPRSRPGTAGTWKLGRECRQARMPDAGVARACERKARAGCPFPCPCPCAGVARACERKEHALGDQRAA